MLRGKQHILKKRGQERRVANVTKKDCPLKWARRRSPVNSSSRFPVAGGLARRALADAHAGIGRE